jgi:hypothetical protein
MNGKHDPFFVVGCARSGTTLLRLLLNAHRDLAIPMESLFMVDYLRAPNAVPLTRIAGMMLDEYEFGEWGVSLSRDKLEGASSVVELIERMHKAYTRHAGKQWWGQKTPRFVRYGAVLKTAWPEAQFLHVVRDARAVVSSLIRSQVHQSNVYFAARRWRNDVSHGLKLERDSPGDVLQLKFEDLVTDPEPLLRGVCDFLKVGYDDGMLRDRKSEGEEYGTYYEEIHFHTAGPPDPDRIDAWRSHLNAGQLQLVETLNGDLMTELGYAMELTGARVSRLYVAGLRLQRLAGILRQARHSLSTRGRFLWCWFRRKWVLRLYRDFLEVNY